MYVCTFNSHPRLFIQTGIFPSCFPINAVQAFFSITYMKINLLIDKEVVLISGRRPFLQLLSFPPANMQSVSHRHSLSKPNCFMSSAFISMKSQMRVHKTCSVIMCFTTWMRAKHVAIILAEIKGLSMFRAYITRTMIVEYRGVVDL
jgi:hypothetical protein